MLGSFLIFFRESLEASMICSIMLAYLRQIGRRERYRDVWIGVGAAIVVATIAGILIFTTIHDYVGTTLQTQIESFTYLIAAVILTYMTFWMQRQSRNIKKHLHAQIDQAMQGGAFVTLALIAFVTVGREGIETVIFMIAIAFQTKPILLVIGALLGIVFGLALSYSIYVAGKRINLRLFFQWMGTLLMLFGAGLLVDTIQDWQQLGWLPFGTHTVWNTSRILSENGTLGDILHSFFGYADNPTTLQIGVYVLYIVIMFAIFWRRKTDVTKSSSLR